MYNAVGELQTHVIDGKHFTEHSLFPKTMVLNGAPRRFQGAVESFLHRGLVHHHCTGGCMDNEVCRRSTSATGE